MPVRDLEPGGRIARPREAPVVCVPLYGAHDFFVRCMESVLRHTGADVPVLVADDASPDPASRAWLGQLEAEGRLEHQVFYLRQPSNLGFVGNVNAAFAAAPTADVVVLNSDCVVAQGWLDRLRAAAHSDTLVATASTLTNHGSIVSLPHRNTPVANLPQDITFERAAALIRQGSPGLRPRIPTAVGHCFYVRRTALDLVGGFDDAFAPGYGEEVDFSQRCVAHGLIHVVADDVLVLHYGSASFGREGENPLRAAHEQIIEERYPWYLESVKEAAGAKSGRLLQALIAGRQSMTRLSVTVDARCLNPVLTGTQIHTLELVAALARTRRLHLRVMVPIDVGEYARPLLDELPIEPVVVRENEPYPLEPTDVVHRPYQISSREDLSLLDQAGDRLVITHQDLIAYRNPSYFPTVRAWQDHRRLTRHALAAADHVMFESSHAERDALAEDLLEPGRHSIVPIGVDHRLATLQAEPLAPPGCAYLETVPFLLCLGTDFHHKNRVFALALLEALRRRHGWQGRLVLAGPHVRYGSSAGEEAAWRASHPEAAEAVVDLPAVGEAEKAWLYAKCTGVVYPTVSEGFGLVPFEAATAGRPCLFARQASLADVLPTATATLIPWDADASADTSFPILADEARAAALVDEIRDDAQALTWDRTAARVIEVYGRALVDRFPAAARVARDALVTEGRRGEMEGRYWQLWNEIGPTGLALVGPDGRLPGETQRALAALTSRKATSGPLFAGLRFAHRLGTGFRGSAEDGSNGTE